MQDIKQIIIEYVIGLKMAKDGCFRDKTDFISQDFQFDGTGVRVF